MIGPTRKTAVELYQIFDMPRRPFVLERKIGQGTFGTVFRSRMLCGCLVATKQVVQDECDVNREVEICKRMAAANQPNIVEVVGVYFTAHKHHQHTLNLVMEYVPQTMRSVLSCLSRRVSRMNLACLTLYNSAGSFRLGVIKQPLWRRRRPPLGASFELDFVRVSIARLRAQVVPGEGRDE